MGPSLSDMVGDPELFVAHLTDQGVARAIAGLDPGLGAGAWRGREGGGLGERGGCRAGRRG